MAHLRVNLEVDGKQRELDVEPGTFLLDVLRDELGILGVREACDEGECGACTVLIDGEPVDSCIYLAGQASGHAVRTVAGISELPTGAAVQRAFVEQGAIQCGYCTPGFIVAASALLSRSPQPSEEQIREFLAGNLCRCTGYGSIVEAVRAAADARREEDS